MKSVKLAGLISLAIASAVHAAPVLPNRSLVAHYPVSNKVLQVYLPNTAISSAAYGRLTSLLASSIDNAKQITSHSWEIGILANALTEVYYPYLSPFSFSMRDTEAEAPYAVLDLITSTLKNYGFPSQTPDDWALSDFLQYNSSPIPLDGRTLVDGEGALGDPFACSTAAAIASMYYDMAPVQKIYHNGLAGSDFAWAVGNQYQHVEGGIRDGRGALSQREDKYELWADMGYMIPPSIAFLGLLTNSHDMLNDALTQWGFESDSLLDSGLYDHVPDFDNRPWATGMGWMLCGFVRVIASIDSAGKWDDFKDTINSRADTVTWVFQSLFGGMTRGDNLIPNYARGTGDGAGDTSGSAMIAAAYYRFRVLFPDRATTWLDGRANDLFTAVVDHLGDDGWLGQVVNPQSPWDVSGYSGHSPEGQSALGLMWAARTAASV